MQFIFILSEVVGCFLVNCKEFLVPFYRRCSLTFIVVLFLAVIGRANILNYRVVGEVAVPCAQAMGLSFANGKFWTFDSKHNFLIEFSELGVIGRTIPVDVKFGIGVGFDGKNIQVVDVTKKEIVIVDIGQGVVLSRMPLPLMLPTGIFIASDHTYIADSQGAGSINVFANQDMQFVTELAAPGRRPFALTLDEKCLWISDNRSPASHQVARVFCLNPKTFAIAGVFDFNEGRRAITGLAVNSDNLWVLSNSTDKLYKLQVTEAE